MMINDVRPLQSVSIVIPIYNEADSIPQLKARLSQVHGMLQQRYLVHYILVDDGSVDGTAPLLPSVVPEGASGLVLTHDQNRGVGASFETGFQHASTDFVCTIDADCTYGPESLLEMLEILQSRNEDVVVASPYHPLGRVDGVQPWRIALSSQCSRMYRIVTPLKLFTYTSIFRAYRGRVVRDLGSFSSGFVSAVEILLDASRHGYRIAELPMTLKRRATGNSKMRLLQTIASHFALLSRCVGFGSGGYPRLRRSHDLRRDALLSRPIR